MDRTNPVLLHIQLLRVLVVGLLRSALGQIWRDHRKNDRWERYHDAER